MTNHDAERDAHLRAALRHAPDADLAPPPALSDAILRAARAAVKPAPPARGWWSTLPWSGSLAGLTAATLFGLIWWPAPSPPPVPADIAEVMAQAPPAPAPATASVEPAAKVAPPPPSVRATPERRRESRRTPESEQAVGAAAPPAAAADAAALPPAAARKAEAPAQAEEAPRVTTAAPRAPAPAAPAAMRMDRAPAVEPRSALADAAPPSLARALQPPASTSWRWQLDGEDRPAAALQPWLERLRTHTRGRWRLHDAALPTGRTLVALEDGQPRARIVLTADAVWWRDEASGSVWWAPLDTAQRTRVGDP
jgi:hypothetical protein